MATEQQAEQAKERNDGLLVEGAAKIAYSIVMNRDVEVRTEPLASWAQATVSGSQDNFKQTQSRLVEALESAQLRAGCADVAGQLGRLVEAVGEAKCLAELGGMLEGGLEALCQAESASRG